MTDLILIRIGCPTPEDAHAIGTALMDAGLVQVFHTFQIEATYRWQGQISKVAETALETRIPGGGFDEACAIVDRLHPYELPSVIATAITMTTPRYADWLGDNFYRKDGK